MAKISSYAIDGTPSLSDKVIGTDVANNNETKNYLISDIASLITTQINVSNVLNAQCTVDQVPSGLDTPLQVCFGPAQFTSSDPVMLDALGTVTVNESGLYLINGYGSIERKGSSGGIAVLAFRALLNGIQVTSSKIVHMDSTGVSYPYEITIPFQFTAGDVFTFEIMRDSAGVDTGGLYIQALSGGWTNVPSSELLMWKIG